MKKMCSLFSVAVLLVACTFSLSLADLNKNRTFISIPMSIPCIRRFNLTHQVGCGKLDKSNFDGIVYAVRSNYEYNRLSLLNDKLIGRKLIVVTVPQLFTKVVDFYLSSRKTSPINGIVLIATDSLQSNMSEYSDDASSPNEMFSIYSALSNTTYPPVNWNTPGHSYMFENFDIPFYVIWNETEASLPFDQCYDKFNKNVFERVDKGKFKIYSTDQLCGMQLGLEYSGAVSSRVCTRRSNVLHTLDGNSFCDPLGGSTSYSYLSQRPSNDLQVMVISSRMDTFSMYEYYTPGANEPVSLSTLKQLECPSTLDFQSI